MRLRAYGRRERDASAQILCLWHGPIWSVLFDPCCYHPQQHQHRLAADGSLRDLEHPAITAWRRCQSAGCGCAHHVNDVGLAVRFDAVARSQAHVAHGVRDDAGRRRKRRFHPSSALTLRPTYNGRSRMWCAQRGDLQVLRRHHVRFAHQRAVSGKGRRPRKDPKHAGRSPLLCQNPYMFVVIGVEGGKGHKGVRRLRCAPALGIAEALHRVLLLAGARITRCPALARRPL